MSWTASDFVSSLRARSRDRRASCAESRPRQGCRPRPAPSLVPGPCPDPATVGRGAAREISPRSHVTCDWIIVKIQVTDWFSSTDTFNLE
jgi:hypothetical protein